MIYSIKNLKTIKDNICIMPYEKSETTEDGIFLTQAKEDKPQIGEVIKIGEEIENIEIGDVVLFNRYSGTDFMLQGKKMIIIRCDDVVGVFEK